MAESSRIPISRVALFMGLVVLGVAIDLGTKSWIFGRLGITAPRMHGDADPIVIVPGIFGLTTSLNEGALFGMGQRMTPLFAVLSLLAICGIGYWLVFGGAGRDGWLVVALAFILAGILGNLYDRLGLPGLTWPNWPGLEARTGLGVYAVRDWLHFQIAAISFDWPVFNLADSLLVAGAMMLFIHVGWRERRNAPTTTTESTAARSP
jgi:signal peptidase II